MRNTYESYNRPVESDIEAIWKNEKTLFVVDTNVLLDFYRQGSNTRKDMIALLEKVKDRIFLPFHVGLEFHRNRVKVIKQHRDEISELKKKFAGAKTILNDEEYNNLKNKFPEVKERYDELIEVITSGVDSILQEVDDLEQKTPYVNSEDSILQQIEDLFDGKVGDEPDQKEVDKIEQEGKERYKNEIPPGYCDVDKDQKRFIYNGVTYMRQFGDLFIWEQIIKEVERRKKMGEKLQSVILLTNDSTGDWIYKVKSSGNKIVGARVELINEMQNRTGVENFMAFDSLAALRLGDKLFELNVKTATYQDLEANKQSSLSPYSEESNLFNKDLSMIGVSKHMGEVLKNHSVLGDYQRQLKFYNEVLAPMLKFQDSYKKIIEPMAKYQQAYEKMFNSYVKPYSSLKEHSALKFGSEDD